MEISAKRTCAQELNIYKFPKLLKVFSLLMLFYFTAVDLGFMEKILRSIFPEYREVIYPSIKPLVLLKDHMLIVLYSSLIALLISVFASVLLLSKIGKPFKDFVLSLAELLQTVPSVVIIGIIVPFLGYGLMPVVIALVAYSVLPLTLNFVTGIEGVRKDLIEVGKGIGFSPAQIFFKIKIPAASQVITAAIKNMIIINISAATLGALVSAGGYGVPILAGIHQWNYAYILQGAIPSSLLAVIVEEIFR